MVGQDHKSLNNVQLKRLVMDSQVETLRLEQALNESVLRTHTCHFHALSAIAHTHSPSLTHAHVRTACLQGAGATVTASAVSCRAG